MSLGFLLGDSDDELNEHQIAWKSKDWTAVKKLADSFKEKSENEFFTTLNEINVGKKRLNVEYLEAYSPYNVNNELSKHIDCIYHTYAMNLLGDKITDQMHFDYLLHSVRSGKRYASKAPGNPVDEILHKSFCKAVAVYYGVGPERGKEYVEEYFSEEQKTKLKKLLFQTVTPELIKAACPYAKKGEIDKVLRAVSDWKKLA